MLNAEEIMFDGQMMCSLQGEELCINEGGDSFPCVHLEEGGTLRVSVLFDKDDAADTLAITFDGPGRRVHMSMEVEVALGLAEVFRQIRPLLLHRPSPEEGGDA